MSSYKILLIRVLLVFLLVSIFITSFAFANEDGDEQGSSLGKGEVEEEEEEEGEPSLKLYKAHGWLLWVSFGLLYPFGILVGKYCQSTFKPWFHLHWILQGLGTICATVGIAISLKEFDALDESSHSKLGLVLALIVWVQTILGTLARPKKGSKLRSTWYVSHWLLGTSVVILGWLNIYKGMDLYKHETNESMKALYIAFSVEISLFAFIYLFLERWGHIESQSEEPQLKGIGMRTYSRPREGEYNTNVNVI